MVVKTVSERDCVVLDWSQQLERREPQRNPAIWQCYSNKFVTLAKFVSRLSRAGTKGRRSVLFCVFFAFFASLRLSLSLTAFNNVTNLGGRAPRSRSTAKPQRHSAAEIDEQPERDCVVLDQSQTLTKQKLPFQLPRNPSDRSSNAEMQRQSAAKPQPHITTALEKKPEDTDSFFVFSALFAVQCFKILHFVQNFELHPGAVF